jgi:TonB family protein
VPGSGGSGLRENGAQGSGSTLAAGTGAPGADISGTGAAGAGVSGAVAAGAGAAGAGATGTGAPGASPAGTGAPGAGISGTGAGNTGGSVGPEALDGGFGLALPVRLPYPPAALARGQAGRARIEMEIEPSGRVARVTVLDETAGWGFGDAARQGYVRARFTPPTVNARPVRVLLRKTIEFRP